jgi:putative endonuclease
VKLGPAGEKVAAKHLKKAGYRIVARNYRSPAGEIDLVALDGDSIVFVEVKTRTDSTAADPEANVTYEKQRQLTRVARYYLMEKSAQQRPARFDVVSVVMPREGKPEVEHFVDAFCPTPR